MKELTDAEVFEEAARLIETYGWVQRQSGSLDVGFCMTGALYHALSTGVDECDTDWGQWRRICGEATDAVSRKAGYSLTSTGWNDSPSRTKPEVVALLRGLAAQG